MSAVAAQVGSALAIHAGKRIITRIIRGRKTRMCPHCNGKINIRVRRKGVVR